MEFPKPELRILEHYNNICGIIRQSSFCIAFRPMPILKDAFWTMLVIWIPKTFNADLLCFFLSKVSRRRIKSPSQSSKQFDMFSVAFRISHYSEISLKALHNSANFRQCLCGSLCCVSDMCSPKLWKSAFCVHVPAVSRQVHYGVTLDEAANSFAELTLHVIITLWTLWNCTILSIIHYTWLHLWAYRWNILKERI